MHKKPTVSAHLVDGCAVALIHLVKLINAADALVCQHQGTSLQHKLLGQLQETRKTGGMMVSSVTLQPLNSSTSSLVSRKRHTDTHRVQNYEYLAAPHACNLAAWIGKAVEATENAAHIANAHARPTLPLSSSLLRPKALVHSSTLRPIPPFSLCTSLPSSPPHLVAHDCCRQADPTGSLARGVHSMWGDACHLLQHTPPLHKPFTH